MRAVFQKLKHRPFLSLSLLITEPEPDARHAFRHPARARILVGAYSVHPHDPGNCLRFLDEEKFLLRNLAGYAYCEIVRYADRIDKVEVNSSRAVMIPTRAFQSLKTERPATESKPKNDEAEEEINS